MQALRVHEHGGPEVLRVDADAPAPAAPGPNQVLVRVNWAGVNYIDTYHRTGLYKLPLPLTLGREGSGIVEQAGAEVPAELQPGARVVFLCPGSAAEKVLLPAARVIPVPAGVCLRDACAAMLQGLTAHYLARSSFPCAPGTQVLVHAAAGGTGGLIVQMAKLLGAEVIATCGSAEKVEEVRKLGADHVINYREQDFVAEVARITEKTGGVNAVYDGVGKATWEGSLKCLRRRGVLVLFGNASGAVPPVDPLLLSNQGSVWLTRPTLVDHVVGNELQERCTELFGWIARGQVKLRVAAEFPLAEARQSHELLESRAAAGKILLRVAPEESAQDEAKVEE